MTFGKMHRFCYTFKSVVSTNWSSKIYSALLWPEISRVRSLISTPKIMASIFKNTEIRTLQSRPSFIKYLPRILIRTIAIPFICWCGCPRVSLKEVNPENTFPEENSKQKVHNQLEISKAQTHQTNEQQLHYSWLGTEILLCICKCVWNTCSLFVPFHVHILFYYNEQQFYNIRRFT